jgi:tripartite-type tricarboxylate transporter receptor subunit TctC
VRVARHHNSRHNIKVPFRSSLASVRFLAGLQRFEPGNRLVHPSCTLAAAAAVWIVLTAPAAAQSSAADSFYNGRSLEVVIGTTPAGGYDLYGRLVARWLGRHIPGHPTVVVKNMPGAGHLRMSNWLYNAAPRDGSVIATAPQQLAVEQAVGSDGIQYDASKFTWIGRAAAVNEVTYTWHMSRTKTLADARTRVTVMGASGPTSPTVLYPKTLNALAGTRFRIIAGFLGSADIELAMQRGEVEGSSKAWASMKVDNADWLREKKVNILVQYSTERNPELPDVPVIAELGRTGGDRAALKLFAMGSALGRSIMAPPGVPPERAAALRKAFMDTMNDPELLEFARERHIEVGPTATGEWLQSLVEQTLATSRETIATVKRLRTE